MMELKDKLKSLRCARRMTQESVAEYLGVSSQTVSKWERGLLSPDISLLPKIALLYQCSIDSLFDMELVWSAEHRRAFEEKIHALYIDKDWEGIYQAWIREIELNPDRYKNYTDVMLHVFRRKLYDHEHVMKLISLADHAEKCCMDDDIRNEIFRIMLQICAESDDPSVREKGKYYYRKLPLLCHSREVYARFVMDGEAYRTQIQKNLIYLIDLAECSVRQLIQSEMPPEEKLFYYQKAAALYETVFDGKYAGFYDSALFSDYCEIAKIYMILGENERAAEYVRRIVDGIARHTGDAVERNPSTLLYTVSPSNAVTTEQLYHALLSSMLSATELEPFFEELRAVMKKLKK